MRLATAVDYNKLADQTKSTKKVHGLTVDVEAPRHTIRQLKDDNGNVVYKKLMLHDYGNIRGMKGRDGDAVDCLVGPLKDAQEVYVVHMIDRGPVKKEREDEDKVMLGFPSADAAKAAFFAHYPKSFFGGMTCLPVDTFKKRLQDTQKPHTHNMLHALGEVHPLTKLVMQCMVRTDQS